MFKHFVYLLLLLSLNLNARGQTIGKYAGEFMAIGVGGRALGLGGSHVAMTSDASSGYWNPAALTRIQYPELVLMHDERFGNLLNYDFAAVAIPYGKNASIAVSVLRLGVDGIPDTRNAWVDVNGNGLFDDDNRPDYDKVSYFNAADWVLFLSYAQNHSSRFSYGANVKLIRRDIADHSALGIGFDVGILFQPVENLFLGANAQDITTTFVAWSTGRNELIAPTFKLGGAYVVKIFGGRLTPSLDLDLRVENRKFSSAANLGPISIDPRFGIEYDFKNIAALRVGYSDIKQITAGVGIHLRKLDVDYAFARFGTQSDNLGDTHRISLRFILEEDRFIRK